MRIKFLLVFLLCYHSNIIWSQSVALKPRIVVLTDIAPNDIEPDDMESTIRLLVHADLFEIEGLVATTGWSNTGGLEHPELIHGAIDAYEKDLPNLMKRSSQTTFRNDEQKQSIGYWPKADYLRSRTVLGSNKMGIRFIGKDNRSAGSDLIIKLADEKDNRPIWVLAWGGANTLAQAIWQVKEERSPAQFRDFLHKLRVYTITDQDRPYAPYEQGGRRSRFDASSHYWMRKEFSQDLLFVWDESAWYFQNEEGKRNWNQYAAEIQQHGHLGNLYPKYKWGVEGDTPSFLNVYPNGLNDPEHPGAGGWGGFFIFSTTRDSLTKAFTNHREIGANAVSRKYEQQFYPAVFNSFVARMAWAKDGKGNRNPVVIVNGDKSIAPLNLTPTSGKTVSIDASASYDPEQDNLIFKWWVLPEAGEYSDSLTLVGANTNKVSLLLPVNSSKKSIHLICEVTDTSTPALTSYRRIVLSPQ